LLLSLQFATQCFLQGIVFQYCDSFIYGIGIVVKHSDHTGAKAQGGGLASQWKTRSGLTYLRLGHPR